MGLLLRASPHRRELEECLLDASVVVDMDGVLEHVVSEIRRGFHEIIEHLEHFDIFLLLFSKGVKRHIVSVNFHRIHRLPEFFLVGDNLLLTFLDFFLFVRKPLKFFIDLLLHHSVEVLLLHFELLDNSSERLLKPIDFFLELLLDLGLQLRVQVFADRVAFLDAVDFFEHVLDDPAHFDNLVRTGRDCVVLLSVLQHALEAEHLVAVLAEEVDLVVLVGLAEL